MNDFERLRVESYNGTPVILTDGKVCGHIIEKKYIKQIHNNHIMTTPPAIAIDKAAFVRYIQPQCDRIFILNMDNGEFYSTSVANFTQKCFYIHRGFGDQYALAMEFWGKNRGVVNQVKMAI